MKPRHVLLAVVVAAIWGFNFIATYYGLVAFPPFLLAALRFVAAALPVLLLPRPQIAWTRLALISCTLFVAQFSCLYLGMRAGMPPGLASVVLQSQAFFTVLFAAVLLGELPSARQASGVLVAALGLVAIGGSVGGAGDVTALGLALAVTAAIAWAAGNLLLRRERQTDMLALISWLSLVALLPFLLLSLLLEGPARIGEALAATDATGVASVLYLALVSTIVGFGAWGYLLRLYPAAVVAPFSLLVPLFGVLSAVLVLDERFGPLRLAGMALILIGLAVVALPWGQLDAFVRRRAGTPR